MFSHKRFSGAPYEDAYKGEQFYGVETEALISMKEDIKRNFDSDSYDGPFLKDLENELRFRSGKFKKNQDKNFKSNRPRNNNTQQAVRKEGKVNS